MRYLRYVWPALLLVAAALAPDMPTTVLLLVAGLLVILLAALREQRIARLISDLHTIFPFRFNQPKTGVAIEQSLNRVRRQTLMLLIGGQLIVFVALLLGDLDITIARNYALLLLVTLAPLSLEILLAIILRQRRGDKSETVRTAIGFFTEDSRALLTIIGLSFVGTVWLYIPAALSALQVLFITCVARPLLSGKSLQATLHKNEHRIRITLTAFVVYGSFIFFFIRHLIDPRYADSVNTVTVQATTVALLVFIATQAVLLAFNPRAPRSTWYRLGMLLIVSLVAVYLPAANSFLMTQGPTAGDWAWVLIAALLYSALYYLGRSAFTKTAH